MPVHSSLSFCVVYKMSSGKICIQLVTTEVLFRNMDWKLKNDGKNIILIFQQGMEQIMNHALNTNYESDVMILTRAANIIRKDIFNSQGFQFSGSFPPDASKNRCQPILSLLYLCCSMDPTCRIKTDSFQGTDISLFQFLSISCGQNVNELPTSSTKKNHQIPDH